MLKKNFKKYNNNYFKMNLIFLSLLISNIVLLMGLIYYYSKVEIKIDFDTIDYLLTVIPSIIILGFVSLKLPRLRQRGGALYDMCYLVIIAIIGLMTSYYNSLAEVSLSFDSYLQMFRVLSILLIFILVSTKLKSFQQMMQGKHSRKNRAICLIIFTLLGLYASRFHIYVDGSPANIRCMVVMISGLLGGPYVGIPVGIITGAYRYTLGGISATSCAISTVVSGIIGSLIFLWNDNKFPKPSVAIILMFLFTGFEMLMVVILSPPSISFEFIRDVYPTMLFASVIGIILFSIVIRDEREKMDSQLDFEENMADESENEIESNALDDENYEIMKLKNKIADFENNIVDLKYEINEFKRE